MLRLAAERLDRHRATEGVGSRLADGARAAQPPRSADRSDAPGHRRVEPPDGGRRWPSTSPSAWGSPSTRARRPPRRRSHVDDVPAMTELGGAGVDDDLEAMLTRSSSAIDRARTEDGVSTVASPHDAKLRRALRRCETCAPARAARGAPGTSRSPSSAWPAASPGGRRRRVLDARPRRRRRRHRGAADRWDVDALYDPEPGRARQGDHALGRFLDDIDRFDAAFFGISPREAAQMDPAAAAAARGGLGGARGRRAARRPAGGSRDRRVRRRLQPQRLLRLAAGRRPRRRSTLYSGTGTSHSVRRRPAVVPARPARPEPRRRHRLLVVAGRGPPGVPEPARRRVPTWRSPAAST